MTHSTPPPPRRATYVDWSDIYTLHSVADGWQIWKARTGNGAFFSGLRWMLVRLSDNTTRSFDAKKEIPVWFQQVADSTGQPNIEPSWSRVKIS